MSKPPEFPEVTYRNTSQTAHSIEANISLRNLRQAERARTICELFCPHMREGADIDCSGIDSAGNAYIRVERSQRGKKWLRLRVARSFNAPCHVTYDAILKKKRKST